MKDPIITEVSVVPSPRCEGEGCGKKMTPEGDFGIWKCTSVSCNEWGLEVQTQVFPFKEIT